MTAHCVHKIKIGYATVPRRLILCLLAAWIMWFVAGCHNDPVDEPEEKPGVGEIVPDPGMDLYGLVVDENGNPVPGVVVSDGFQCTLTNAKGIYQMKKSAGAEFVHFSVPSDYEVPTVSATGQMALFYSPIGAKRRHDFKLKKLPATETEFTLVCIGDPQVTNNDELNRFKYETMDDLKTFTNSFQGAVYGLVMGDVTGDKPLLFDQMKALMGSSRMPVFTTIGNHDKVPGTHTSLPRTTTDFSKVFGPVNYSFNRGDVHFVCLDNVIYTNSSDYGGGFTASQIEWLKQDLKYVPKSKMVIVFFHIPVRGTSSVKNRSLFLDALQGFAEVHLMSGHTHYTENYLHANPVNTWEHVHAGACGAWWRSTINGDGTPNGYAVYRVSGNSLKDWYYKSVRYEKDYQIRLHWGDASFGGTYGYFTYNQGSQTVVANVWNADSRWKVEAYENGVKTGALTPLPATMRDAWSLGYHIGVLNRNPENYSPVCKHLYLYQMVNPDAELEIRATDGFGAVYKQKTIISDFTTATGY